MRRTKLFLTLTALSLLQLGSCSKKNVNSVTSSISSSSSTPSVNPTEEEVVSNEDDFDVTYSTVDVVFINGLLNDSVTNLIIPDTIKGKKVTGLFSNGGYYDNLHFAHNLKLKSITIGANFEKNRITNKYFEGSTNIEKISVSSNNPYYFVKNNCLFYKDSDGSNVLTMTIKGFSIPEDVANIKIAKDAIAYLDIDKLYIPKNVISIDDQAIHSNYNLTDITSDNDIYKVVDGFLVKDDTLILSPSVEYPKLPSIISKIGQAAFAGTKIKEFTFYSNLSFASNSDSNIITFKNSDLEKVTFEDGFSCPESFDSAFSSCKNLKEIEVPSGITEIKAYAFASCINLESIKIPNSATKISGDAFINTPKLENVYFDSTNTNFKFENECILKGSELIALLSHKETYVFEPTIIISQTSINGLTGIKNLDFSNCNYNLPSYKIKNCKLKSVILPNGPYSLNQGTFQYCEIDEVIIPERFDKNFSGSYFSDSIVKKVTVKEGNQTYKVVDNALIKIATSELSFYPNIDSETEAKIPAEVLKIGAYCFAHNKNLKFIDIPSTVTEIGNGAFQYSNIENVIIPSSVNVLGNAIFAWSSHMKEITINNPNIQLTKDSLIPSLTASSYSVIHFNGTMVEFKKLFNNSLNTYKSNFISGNGKDTLREVEVNDSSVEGGKRIVKVEDIIW